MRYPATLAFALFGIALCLFNSTGYDPHNVFLFMFSVPIWFVELFTDIHRVNVWSMYALTVASYVLIGYLVDLGIHRVRTKKQA
ncbi:hypothetical protein [Cohnella caldifontis]|uniref:hypothetical protein n=1 Tax=Cohnella caldifontis TaxID=3027471 RepID=UPI0023EC299E|nr:hypothetical protein [Cohnella sp. YIM B05605]